MTMLEDIYKEQAKTQEYFRSKDPDLGCLPYSWPITTCEKKKELESKFKDDILYLIKEATEVLDEINYKKHVSTRKEINRDNVIEELVDIFKYWLNLCLLMDFKPKEIHKIFKMKTKKVIEKKENEKHDA